MIQRYNFLQGRFGVDSNTVCPDTNGSFVLYTDHEQAVKEKDETLKSHHVNFNREYAHMVGKKNEQIAALTAELEGHAWEISPAMAQAKIDELTAASAKQAEVIERLPEDVRSFIYTVTLFLQASRSKTPEQMDVMFQRAYRLYNHYDVDPFREIEREEAEETRL